MTYVQGTIARQVGALVVLQHEDMFYCLVTECEERGDLSLVTTDENYMNNRGFTGEWVETRYLVLVKITLKSDYRNDKDCERVRWEMGAEVEVEG